MTSGTQFLVPQDPCFTVQMALASPHPQAFGHDNHGLSPHHAHRRFEKALDLTGGGTPRLHVAQSQASLNFTPCVPPAKGHRHR